MTLPRRRLMIGALLFGAFYFALQGGQYSTLDLLRQQSRINALRAAIDSVGAENDSLELYRKALNSNLKVQERVAREVWGMSKAGEIVYRFVDPG